MFTRTLKILKNNSFFIFGPRGTGKSTLIKSWLPSEKTYSFDLLDFELEGRLTKQPSYFKEILRDLPPHIEWIFIDEVQKLPFLLDEVHRQIELNPKRFFALTGSSARKLKKGKANLLAGRAFTYELYPLTIQEMGQVFRLEEALTYGTLPRIFSLPSPEHKNEFLRSYAQTYLREEIQMEGLIRNLPSFRNFLYLAAKHNGQILNYSNFASDVGVDVKTIKAYYQILEDTLIGFLLPAHQRSLRKRQRTHPKFYFFDTGVKRALADEISQPLFPRTPSYGWAFEHFWITEIYRLSHYQRKDYRFSYFGTNDVEIDLVIEKPDGATLFVEFKSSESVPNKALGTLETLAREKRNAKSICICSEPVKRKVGKVFVCPWQSALKELELE